MDKNEVLKYVWKIETLKEIHEFWDILKTRHGQIMQAETFAFTPGDEVEWDSKIGRKVSGVVVSRNKKTVSVKTDGGVIWRVSASLLRKKEL